MVAERQMQEAKAAEYTHQRDEFAGLIGETDQVTHIKRLYVYLLYDILIVSVVNADSLFLYKIIKVIFIFLFHIIKYEK